MPFDDPIIGGGGDLIRDSIHSPNYQAGLLGWAINKDGSAEFNSVTIRGNLFIGTNGQGVFVYRGAPAAGTLMFSIAPIGGQDAWGNWYASGVEFYNAGSSFDGILFKANSLDHSTWADAQIRLDSNENLVITGPVPAGGATVGASVLLSDVDGSVQIKPASGAGGAPSVGSKLLLSTDLTDKGIQFGNGPTGKYYYERVILDTTQPISSGVVTLLNGMSLVPLGYNDYTSAWDLVNGVWTCPDPGVYEIDYKNWYSSGWVGGSRMQMRVLLNSAIVTTAATIGLQDFTPTTPGVAGESVNITRELSKGDSLRFTSFQATGATQTLNPGALNHNYVAIKRQL